LDEYPIILLFTQRAKGEADERGVKVEEGSEHRRGG